MLRFERRFDQVTTRIRSVDEAPAKQVNLVCMATIPLLMSLISRLDPVPDSAALSIEYVATLRRVKYVWE